MIYGETFGHEDYFFVLIISNINYGERSKSLIDKSYSIKIEIFDNNLVFDYNFYNNIMNNINIILNP